MPGNPSYVVEALGHVWDPSANGGLGGWVKATQASGGAGGGGDASAANQVIGNASLASIDDKLTGPLEVDGTVAIINFPATQPVSGSVSVGNFPATQAVSLASVPSHAVTNAGTFAVQATDTRPGTSTVTSVNASATSVTVAAANAARRGLLVFNDADKALYLKLGATASVTSYSVRIAAGGYYEVPNPSYSGIVDGMWEAAPTGAARVTELT